MINVIEIEPDETAKPFSKKRRASFYLHCGNKPLIHGFASQNPNIS